MANTQERIDPLRGKDVYDRNGDKVGTVGQVWADDAGRPSWVSVHTGLFGLNESLLPLYDASVADDRLITGYDKDLVRRAPNVDVGAHEEFDADGLARLYSHYGLARGDERTGADDDAMTRSEERLRVGTERERAGTARLRKHVVTEHVQTTVPVQREEVRLETEPITDANRDRAYAGRDLSEAEHEVTLHAERPVVDKETVPVERVRLGTGTVRDEHTVDERVRKERVEADLPDERGSRRFG
ncbi:hypothetical protein Val02_06950 [Virgisporangium aliadipatigenens]|uniref:DUF2382 domain-containing protein n=1 Tax=Virgisporangium aliadipatigenens TaxID=741659 RepID=A0A8J4DMX1_9ACTN|nr:PRC and DUF2382 domain-containing protein [Virgisporangium aliadipatigenens]GIJ43809.1 hypothetical protein Val02_06950 [Virgisporangium aliadipatigenens]